jgi:hypothetical protein
MGKNCKARGGVPGIARNRCYTNPVLRNVTITLSDESALWARRQAAERNISVSRLVGSMIEDQMRQSDEYWKAFKSWKSLKPVRGADGARRARRDEVHER